MEGGSVLGKHLEQEREGPVGGAPVQVTISDEQLFISPNVSSCYDMDYARSDNELAVLFFLSVGFVNESARARVENVWVSFIP